LINPISAISSVFPFVFAFMKSWTLLLNNVKISGCSNWFLKSSQSALSKVKLQHSNLLDRRNVLLSAQMVLNLLSVVRYQILLHYGLLSVSWALFLSFLFTNDIC
jgi:hypothetical protein